MRTRADEAIQKTRRALASGSDVAACGRSCFAGRALKAAATEHARSAVTHQMANDPARSRQATYGGARHTAAAEAVRHNSALAGTLRALRGEAGMPAVVAVTEHPRQSARFGA